MESDNSRTSRQHWILYGIILILLLIDGYLNKVWADHADQDIRCGLLLYSHHPFAEPDEYNEEHEGAYCSWNGLAIGSYTNSYENSSTLLTYTSILGNWHDVEFSITAGIVNGYPEEGESTEQEDPVKGFDGWGEYRPWASVNAKYSVFKLYYAYRVWVFGLEFELF